MARYADPELLISEWVGARLNLKTWADPILPGNHDFTAPIGHFQRSPGEGDTVLTLDSVLLDVDWVARVADHAREAAELTRSALRIDLPLHVFGNGVFVKSVFTVAAPSWAPATGTYRRSATYRVVLHGLI